MTKNCEDCLCNVKQCPIKDIKGMLGDKKSTWSDVNRIKDKLFTRNNRCKFYLFFADIITEKKEEVLIENPNQLTMF